MTREERAQYIFEKLMENPEFRKVFVDAITDVANELDEVVKVINALTQEPCEDCVSRDAVRKLFKEWMDDGEEYAPHVFKELVEALPPVTPQQKMGQKGAIKNE